MDNLVFRYSSENSSEEVKELPSVKNRFKIAQALIIYGEENEVFDQVTEEAKQKRLQDENIRGA